MNEEQRNTSDQELPGSVSSQNGEEAEPGHDGKSEARGSGGGGDGDGGDSSGKSSEGSQSTGNPDSAG